LSDDATWSLQDDADVHFTTPPSGFDDFDFKVEVEAGVGFGVVAVLTEDDGVIVELAEIGRSINKVLVPFVVVTVNKIDPSKELDGVNDAVFANTSFKLGIVEVIDPDELTVWS